MKTVTLCGSMRFEKNMQEIALALELHRGFNVIQCIYSIPGRVLSREEREALSGAHRRKIELSDAVYVVDIGGYVGSSTKEEIAYAQSLGKEILFHSQSV